MKKKKNKWIKKILIALLILLVAIQFVRPEKNKSGDTSKDISTIFPVSENLSSIFLRSCADCHSNQTVYPWYSEIQPVAWWLNDHIEEGKRELNLNAFANYPAAVQKKKLEECMEQIKDDEMPLSSYTFIHTDAVLNEKDKQTINDWCNAMIDTLKAKYPPDSLILKKRKRD
jgi:Haem-binding domain